LGAGCSSITQVTVNAATAAITGTLSVCVGATTTLSHATPGGVWSTGNAAKAIVGSTSGVVTGVAPGTAIITYSLGTGCIKTVTVTIKASPAAITGATTVAIGTTTTLSNATTGGSWSSATPSVASIGSASGIVTGIAIGSSTITYRVTTTGCSATQTITVTDSAAAKGAINDVPVTNDFGVYPNPASDHIIVNSPVAGSINLSSIDGKTVLAQTIASGISEISLPVNLAPGMYVLKFYGNDHSTHIIKITVKTN
jgi:uncharacterized protein YjdB